MDEAQRLALTLAQTAETSMGYPSASAVVERARKYLDFLLGVPQAVETTVAQEGETRGF